MNKIWIQFRIYSENLIYSPAMPIIWLVQQGKLAVLAFVHCIDLLPWIRDITEWTDKPDIDISLLIMILHRFTLTKSYLQGSLYGQSHWRLVCFHIGPCLYCPTTRQHFGLFCCAQLKKMYKRHIEFCKYTAIKKTAVLCISKVQNRFVFQTLHYEFCV